MTNDERKAIDRAVAEHEFQCEWCGGVCEKAWTDEEAKAECEALWDQNDDMAVVCEDCFQELMGNLTAAIGKPREGESK